MFSPLKTLGMIYVWRRPFLLNHKINIACDCRCKFCNSWQIKEDPELLLSLAEIQGLLDRAKAVGMLSYSVWGGEPLLREDTPQILSHAKKRGFFTTLSTNGSLLRDRASELVLHTSVFLVSLDGIGKTHDHVRGVPGLFDKLVAGIEAVKKSKGRVRLYYNVNQKTVVDVEAAAKFAQEHRVSIFYFPVLRFAGYNDSLVLEREMEREVFSKILTLKAEGYPIVNLASYLRLIRDGGKISCRFPRYHIYVDYEGTLYTCDLGPRTKLAVWGNARDTDLGRLFASEEFQQKTRTLVNCNACRLSCGEMGAGSPLLQFPIRAWTRISQEWLGQR